MKLIDELRAEHDLIEQVVGSLRTFVAERGAGGGDPLDGQGFVDFFRLFTGDWHHLREEQVLLPALTRELALPADRGPVAEILRQHGAMAATLSALGPLLTAAQASDLEREEATRLTLAYGDALLKHIDAENSVLFPESEARLVRCGVFDLAARQANEREVRARAIGERLLQRYPPTENPALIRGEGCVMCPAYGDTCRGLEREWWSDEEWEEFGQRGGFE